ncbi:MAG: hypothetical protein IT373_11275 [Polyangiaceae bacterium]|nr:hypothetical protein [Polyangiaceae bacterium]
MVPHPSVIVLEHTSECLRDNAMGDPHVRRLPVYLPPGYAEGRHQRLPVVYLLAGWSGRGAHYLGDPGVFAPSLADELDRRILSGALPPVLVAFPDCSSRLGASQYVNSAANGPYMDYLCDELVPFVDQAFRTDARRERRALVGHSSGGFGALVTGMLRPDRFAAVGSSAGDSWYEFLYVHTLPQTLGAIRKAGSVEAFLAAWLASPNPRGLLGPDAEAAMLSLSMCPCYAPNLAVPVLRGDLYFDAETGALVPEVWQKFLAWDPVLMVDRHRDALRSLRAIDLEAGSDDEYGLHLGHRQLARALGLHGIAHRIAEYPGKHGGHHYRMPDRILRLLAALGV